MADRFQLEIVTPEKMVARTEAEEVEIPGKNGYLGVLPGHAPLITELGAGEISYRLGEERRRFAVAWGFAEILPDRVTVLAETVERVEEIDIDRARRSLAQAEQALQTAESEEDFARAQAKIMAAQARIDVAQNKSPA
jgi:F-type H+-transporting ATPase subunit epsilon